MTTRKQRAGVPDIVETADGHWLVRGLDPVRDFRRISEQTRRLFKLLAAQGPLPPDAVLRRTCDCPGCVRPACHVLTSRSALVLDSPIARLTPADVRAIRREIEEGTKTRAQIAKEHGLDPSAVSHIGARRRWPTVP